MSIHVQALAMLLLASADGGTTTPAVCASVRVHVSFARTKSGDLRFSKDTPRFVPHGDQEVVTVRLLGRCPLKSWSIGARTGTWSTHQTELDVVLPKLASCSDVPAMSFADRCGSAVLYKEVES